MHLQKLMSRSCPLPLKWPLSRKSKHVAERCGTAHCAYTPHFDTTSRAACASSPQPAPQGWRSGPLRPTPRSHPRGWREDARAEVGWCVLEETLPRKHRGRLGGAAARQARRGDAKGRCAAPLAVRLAPLTPPPLPRPRRGSCSAKSNLLARARRAPPGIARMLRGVARGWHPARHKLRAPDAEARRPRAQARPPLCRRQSAVRPTDCRVSADRPAARRPKLQVRAVPQCWLGVDAAQRRVTCQRQGR